MKYFLFSLLLLLQSQHTSAQSEIDFRVMWYNVENLFDTADDSLTNDNEFLPEGNRRWTNKRYRHKLQQLSKVISAAGEWDTPALIGLCEVENDSVLTHLLLFTPLKNQRYQYCISKSHDPRGIKVALLYQRDKFKHIGSTSIPIRPSGKRHKPTRDILHVWGTVHNHDTLDVFLCHFPSRYGGEKESEPDRIDAASTLKYSCDSIHEARRTPQILIMGDFNDMPADKSIREVLGAVAFSRSDDLPMPAGGERLTLINLFADSKRLAYPGSHKYQGQWSQLDQIIVNRTLASPQHSMKIIETSIRLLTPSFLLTEDKTWGGSRPKRTYYGYKYEGGYSDHIPLIVDWKIFVRND